MLYRGDYDRCISDFYPQTSPTAVNPFPSLTALHDYRVSYLEGLERCSSFAQLHACVFETRR